MRNLPVSNTAFTCEAVFFILNQMTNRFRTIMELIYYDGFRCLTLPVNFSILSLEITRKSRRRSILRPRNHMGH